MNKSLVSDCIKLFIITVIAGLALGLVYNITKEPIAHQKELAKQESYKTVFEDANSFEEVEFDDAEIAELCNENGLTGITMNEIMAALDADGKQI